MVAFAFEIPSNILKFYFSFKNSTISYITQANMYYTQFLQS